jgi:adiponectin receptor
MGNTNKSMTNDNGSTGPDGLKHRFVPVVQQQQLMEEAAVETTEQSILTSNDGSVEVVVTRVTTTRYMLLNYEDLPEWMKDNDCLLTRHRPHLPSYWECFRSVFYLHTETGNIWTHGLGALLFILLAIELYVFNEEYLPLVDKLMFAIYFAAAICCLSFSTTYHVLTCHSDHVSQACKKLDYIGISVMITGSFVPFLHYAFYCHAISKLVYMVIFPILGGLVIFATLWKKMGTPKFRKIRATIFIAFGLSTVVPYIHWVIVTDIYYSVFKLVMVGVLYVGGALLYANRIPERLLRGKCDLVFHSHQLFHVCVILAALLHYHNLHEIAKIRQFGAFECPVDT